MGKREEHVIVAAEGHDAMSSLPGFRFHPTDEELVRFYLRWKVENRPCLGIIKEIDIYQHDPWDLPKVITAREKERYFFCLRGRKYKNSIRPNRVTRSGFWKATGVDRPIYSQDNSSACIGLKKSLVYYRGFAGKGTKTEWMMHEFRLPSGENKIAATVQEAEVWTICRIFKRSCSVHRKQLHSFELSSTHHKQMVAPWSSSVATSCFESAEMVNEYSYSVTSCCYPDGANDGGEARLIADYLFPQYQNDQVLHGGQIWDSIGQDPWMEPAAGVAETPCVDELFIASEWDELGRIEEFMADHSLSL